jgi:hypothetical protein
LSLFAWHHALVQPGHSQCVCVARRPVRRGTLSSGFDVCFPCLPAPA